MVAAAEKAFDVNIESIFNDIPNSKELIQKLQNFPLGSSPSCLSCQVGIAQHIDHRDLLKVESLSKMILFVFIILAFVHVVYNQIRGFKTRHSEFTGIRGGSSTQTGSSRHANEFDTYGSGSSSSIRQPHFSNDPNQPPLAAFVNRVCYI